MSAARAASSPPAGAPRHVAAVRGRDRAALASRTSQWPYRPLEISMKSLEIAPKRPRLAPIPSIFMPHVAILGGHEGL